MHAGKVIYRFVGSPMHGLSSRSITKERMAARKHKYNVDGEMLANVAAFNDAAMPEHYLGAGNGSVTGLSQVVTKNEEAAA